jgi:hypothetical protein
MPILNIIVRPTTGYITDRWQCRKQIFLGASLVNALFTLLIYYSPEFKSHEYTNDIEVVMHWKFWMFVAIITTRMMLWMVGDVLQDTICLEILGSFINIVYMYTCYRQLGTSDNIHIAWAIRTTNKNFTISN